MKKIARQARRFGARRWEISPLVMGGCLALGLVVTAQASVVTLTASDGTNDTYTSFNSAGNWDNAAAPNSANTYFTSTFDVRTPNNANDYTFAGYSLTLETGGRLIYNGTKGTNATVVSRLILSGGTVLNSPTNTSSDFHLKGGIEVGSAGGTIDSGSYGSGYAASSMIVESKLTGTGTLTLAGSGGGTITFTSSTSTFAGDILITSNAKLTMASGSVLNFVIGDAGVNNSVSSTNNRYATFNGTFNLDLTNAGSILGDSWTLVDVSTLTATFSDSTFAIAGFTKTTVAPNQNLWSDGTYQFDESTGVLSVVPEPASLALLSLGMMVGVVRRRRA